MLKLSNTLTDVDICEAYIKELKPPKIFLTHHGHSAVVLWFIEIADISNIEDSEFLVHRIFKILLDKTIIEVINERGHTEINSFAMLVNSEDFTKPDDALHVNSFSIPICDEDMSDMLKSVKENEFFVNLVKKTLSITITFLNLE